MSAPSITVGPSPVDEDLLVGRLSVAEWTVIGQASPDAQPRGQRGKWFVWCYRATEDGARSAARIAPYRHVVIVPPAAVQEAAEAGDRKAPAELEHAQLNAEVISHMGFLLGTLIPDLRDSGHDATAEDLQTCCDLMQQLLDRDLDDGLPDCEEVNVVPLAGAQRGQAMLMAGPMPVADAEELARRLAGGGR